MSEEEPNPEDAAFDELIKHQPESVADESVEISTLWEGVGYLWPQMHEGVLVKGIVLTESIDSDGKVFRWQHSPDMAPWDVLGMLHQAISDIQSDNLIQHLVGDDDETSDDDDEEIEDEQ